MHLRSILIVTIPLPLAVLASFLGMYYAGISSNIMSLAGIAIAIGVLVDAGIVVTENAFRVIEQRRIDTARPTRGVEAVLDATRLVGRPVFFSMAIILLAFVPVFALTGQEGQVVSPARRYEDVRGAGGHDDRRHARPRAVHAAPWRTHPPRAGQSRDARAAPRSISPCCSARSRIGA